MSKQINLKAVRLLVFDFDGVMTDNKVIVSETGEESVVVNRADGWGVKMLKAKGYPLLILSTEKNKVVAARAAKLDIPVLHGVDDKGLILQQYCLEQGYDLNQVLYVGNDLNDMPAMQVVGIRVVPADAYHKVKAIADVILDTPGGGGVVRELAELICDEEDGHA